MGDKGSIASKTGNHHNGVVEAKSRIRIRRRCATLAALILLVGTPLLGYAKAANDEAQDVTRATLENGLRVVIVRNPLAPVATIVVNYLVGSNEAPQAYPGMAHALEHMMFRGSPGLSADQLSSIAAGMGGRFNARTQQTVTQYMFTVPAPDLDVALQLEAIRMRGVLNSDELWQKERGAIEQEIAADLSNPQYVFFTRLLKRMFDGTPYAHDALGTRPSFDRTDGAMLRKFYDSWYAPNNAILVISGGIEPERVLSQVKTLFEKIPAKKLPARPAVKLKPVKPATLHQTTDRPYAMVTMSVRMPGFESPDYAAAQVLGDVLNSQRAALYGLVVKGEVLGAGFDQTILPKAGIGAAALSFPAGGDPKLFLKKLQTIIGDYAKNGVPADLVEATKRRTLTGVEFSKNTVNGLAMMWSHALAVQGRDSPQDNIDAIARVTVDDVNRVARTYLDLKNAVVGIFASSSSGKPVSSRDFKGEESFAQENVKPAELPKWAAAALARLSMPEAAVQPVDMTLSNGIRLIVQPVAVSDTVSLFGRIKTNDNVQTPKGREGVSGVLARLFSFGTEHLDRLAFQKAVDDIGAEVGAGTSFFAQALTDNFERSVELLADNELHPALPQDAFKVVKGQVSSALKGILQSPDYLTGRAMHKALFPENDPTLREATPETVNGLSLDDVRRYYENTFRPDLTTIVMIGKVTPERARALVEKYFGEWTAAGPKPDTLLPAVPPNKASVIHVPNNSQVQDRVTLAHTLELNRFNPDYYALQLGNHVLTGGFYASRLYRDLREEAGLVYFVTSSLDAGETRGLFSVSYASDPPNVSKARTLVIRDLTAMQSEPVSDEELHQAKALVLRQIPLAEASVSNIANRFLSLSVIGLPLDESMRAARRYFEMTADDVQSAYKKWLRPEDMAQVTEGPPLAP